MKAVRTNRKRTEKRVLDVEIRVQANLDELSRAAMVLFLGSGEEKAKTLRQALVGGGGKEIFLSSSSIRPAGDCCGW